MTPPTVGQYHVWAEIVVNDLASGGDVTAEFRGNASVHGLSTMLVVWSGANRSISWRLINEPQTVFAGGTSYVLTIQSP